MTTLNAGEGKLRELELIVANRIEYREDSGVGFTWGEFSSGERAIASRIVRALLTALRTPSDEMVEAAFEAWTGDNWYATDEIKAAERAKLGPAFTAAIDVLLTPKDPEQ